MTTNDYVLITPARNEEAFIGQTLQSVVNQTIQPLCWIIIDDGSTDQTAGIVREFEAKHPFIQLISRAGDKVRNFGSKSKAVQFAYEQLQPLDFGFVGNLDADIILPPDYYESILEEFAQNPDLGLAGGIRYEPAHNKDELVLVDCARNSVGGPIQLFRRECWETIGGYMVLPYGGIDAVAEISARMHGWTVRSFPQYRVQHCRTTGTANRSVWSALYRAGIRDYTIGYHLLFEIARSVQRLKQKPYIVGSLVMLAGYLSAMLRRLKRPVPAEMVSFLHREQLSRLRNAVRPDRTQSPREA